MKKSAVVILNWNSRALLQRFLPVVIRNTPSEVDIYVADNGSSDGSADMVEAEFPAVKTIRLERNYGFAEGYNIALEQVDADYCVLLNSDVETPEGWFEPLAEALDADASVAAAAPKLLSLENRDEFEYAGASGGFIDFLGYPFCRGRILQSVERDEGQYDDAREVFWASGAALCCRMDVFRKLGGFAGGFFAHMEEIDLCWRMQLAGYKVMTIPSSKVYHLGGGTLRKNSPGKVYYNHRNNLAMLLRCAPAGQRIAAILLRPFTDMLSAAVYLVCGHPSWSWAVVRAYADFIGRHRQLSAERKIIRAAAIREAHGVYKGSIVLRYIFGKHIYKGLEL